MTNLSLKTVGHVCKFGGDLNLMGWHSEDDDDNDNSERDKQRKRQADERQTATKRKNKYVRLGATGISSHADPTSTRRGMCG